MSKTIKTTQVDANVYNRLCEVVKDGTFVSIDFSPWHKGCDTCLDATCDWPELQDEMEEWYYENISEFDVHTTLYLTPEITNDQLLFKIYTVWDRNFDQFSDLSKEWDEELFQDFVFDLLPKAIKEKAPSENLWVSVDLEYEPKKLSVKQFSVTDSGKSANIW